MSAIYNEIDPYAAAWLRNLIAAGHIAPGVVDERSIVDIDPDELRGYTQVHCFAGIGVWSYALRLAGWPDDRPVWTGSCPCQPFSAAGKRGGHEDERHLWPAWHRLIRECAPAIVFGEQVASADGRAWLDVVLTGLEDDHYAVAAADLSAAGVGAPHRRQRLYFVAHAERGAAERRGLDLGGAARGAEGKARQRQRVRAEPWTGGDARLVVHADDDGRQEQRLGGLLDRERPARGEICLVGDAELHGLAADQIGRSTGQGEVESGLLEREGSASGFWSDAEWIACRDGKARPVEPGTFPLAHGAPARVGRLRAYGNAIVPQVAAAFIEAAVTT